MLNIFNLASRRNLRKLDKELSKMNYDELLAGLQELNRVIIDDAPADKNTEELRAVYAITQCCLELKKIYKEDE